MQNMNWNDFRYLLAIQRAGSLIGAARQLNVDATTVSRRVKALQERLQAPLLERLADGAYQLTPIGLEAARRAERVEHDLSAFEADVTGSRLSVSGSVRISAVPMVINRLLTPRVPAFLAAYPDVELDLNSDIRNLNMSKRETDIAVRLARPREGGHNVVTKRLGALRHAIYASSVTNCEDDVDQPWITYQGALQFLPQAQWMAREVPRSGGAFLGMRASEAEGVIEAVAAGAGRSVLPIIIGDRDKRLRRAVWSGPEPIFVREVWIMLQADVSRLARTEVVCDWIADIFKADA